MAGLQGRKAACGDGRTSFSTENFYFLSQIGSEIDLIPRVWETRLLGKQRPELGRAGRSRDSG